MLREARRYDTDNQTRIANEILREVTKDRSLGLLYGTPVKIHSSIGQAGLNGHVGEVRGESQSSLLRPAFLEPPPHVPERQQPSPPTLSQANDKLPLCLGGSWYADGNMVETCHKETTKMTRDQA